MTDDHLPIDLNELVVFLGQEWLDPLIQQSPVNFFTASPDGSRLVICDEEKSPWVSIPSEWRVWFETVAEDGREAREDLLQDLAKCSLKVKRENLAHTRLPRC
jgi:hypothetical protein